MNEFIITCLFRLAKTCYRNNEDRKASVLIYDTCAAVLNGGAVQKAAEWIEARPYALQLEKEVARAIRDTLRFDGVMRTTVFNQYREKLCKLSTEYAEVFQRS